MEDANRSVMSTQKLPSLCSISKSIPGWHLKSSIKVMYFVPTKNIELKIPDIIDYQSLPVSLRVSKRAPHRLRPLLKPSPPLLPVQFTQSSLWTAATLIVCSFYAVTSSTFFLHLFLILLRAESQSLTRATPPVHQRRLPLIPPSPIAPTRTSPLAIHSSELPPSPSLHCCHCLFTAVTNCLPSLPTTSASAASASASASAASTAASTAVYRC
jgi:hypothetical protein